MCESQFMACAWRKCSTVYKFASIRINEGATLVGVASPARESNDTTTTKCGCLIYGFSQCSVVLHRGLQHGSDKGL